MPVASIHYPDNIVAFNNNGGWHHKGKRAYRNAVRTIMNCLLTYREPRLYHLCFEGQSHKKQVKMLNALVQIADRAGIKCEWFAARETADKTKVDHLHCFMIIDAYGIKVAKVFNQFDDGQVAKLCAEHKVNFSIFKPKDDLGIHGNNTYMALPYQGPGNQQTELGSKRLVDALIWLTYNYKARSKPLDADADGQIFPASRPNRKKKLDSPSAALPAEQEVIAVEASQGDYKPLQGDSRLQGWAGIRLKPERHQGAINASEAHNNDKGIDLKLTPAQTYLCRLYETCVDADMDVEAVRLYLLDQGIRKTPAMIVDDLEHTFGFLGYAESHPAPAKPDTVKLDALIQLEHNRGNRRYGRYAAVTNPPRN